MTSVTRFAGINLNARIQGPVINPDAIKMEIQVYDSQAKDFAPDEIKMNGQTFARGGNTLRALSDQLAKGDVPSESQLREALTITFNQELEIFDKPDWLIDSKPFKGYYQSMLGAINTAIQQNKFVSRNILTPLSRTDTGRRHVSLRPVDWA